MSQVYDIGARATYGFAVDERPIAYRPNPADFFQAKTGDSSIILKLKASSKEIILKNTVTMYCKLY